MTQLATRQIDLSILVATVRNKRVQRLMDRVQKQRERAHQRQRDRIFAKARMATRPRPVEMAIN
jgi:hypothetical protein